MWNNRFQHVSKKTCIVNYVFAKLVLAWLYDALSKAGFSYLSYFVELIIYIICIGDINSENHLTTTDHWNETYAPVTHTHTHTYGLLRRVSDQTAVVRKKMRAGHNFLMRLQDAVTYSCADSNGSLWINANVSGLIRSIEPTQYGTGSRSGPILSWRLIMKQFLRSFSSLPLIYSRRVVVSYKWKYVHELLVNRLFKPAQEKVWLGELTVPQWP